MPERYSDLRAKEVINIADGRSVGHVCDLILDCHKGCVEALVVPGCNKVRSIFTGGDDIIIPWSKIVKLGEDVILVELENYRLHK